MSIVPFDQREGVIWFNGEFVPWKDAKIHVLTHALHYASAVFEGERAYSGEIFRLTAHTERLFASAQMLRFVGLVPACFESVPDIHKSSFAHPPLPPRGRRTVVERPQAGSPRKNGLEAGAGCSGARRAI